MKFLMLASCLRFVPLPKSTIKTYTQIDKYFREAASYFSFNFQDSIEECAQYDVFMFLEGKKLASFLAASKHKCYSIRNRKEYDLVVFYFCTTTTDFRGQGLSYRTMIESVEYLKRFYKLREDTILGLHVSPNDVMMPVACRMYYTLGFHKGVFIKQNPVEMIYRIDELFDRSIDFLEASDRNEEGTGHYFMMYCKLCDFGMRKAPGNVIEKAKKLFDVLKERKKKCQN